MKENNSATTALKTELIHFLKHALSFLNML